MSAAEFLHDQVSTANDLCGVRPVDVALGMANPAIEHRLFLRGRRGW